MGDQRQITNGILAAAVLCRLVSWSVPRSGCTLDFLAFFSFFLSFFLMLDNKQHIKDAGRPRQIAACRHYSAKVYVWQTQAHPLGGKRLVEVDAVASPGGGEGEGGGGGGLLS